MRRASSSAAAATRAASSSAATRVASSYIGKARTANRDRPECIQRTAPAGDDAPATERTRQHINTNARGDRQRVAGDGATGRRCSLLLLLLPLPVAALPPPVSPAPPRPSLPRPFLLPPPPAHRPSPTTDTHTRASATISSSKPKRTRARTHARTDTHTERERKDGATPQHSAAPREMIGYRCAVIVNHGSRTSCSAPSWARRARLISSTFPSWKPCSQRASAPRHGRGAGCLSVGGGCAVICQLGGGEPYCARLTTHPAEAAAAAASCELLERQRRLDGRGLAVPLEVHPHPHRPLRHRRRLLTRRARDALGTTTHYARGMHSPPPAPPTPAHSPQPQAQPQAQPADRSASLAWRHIMGPGPPARPPASQLLGPRTVAGGSYGTSATASPANRCAAAAAAAPAPAPALLLRRKVVSPATDGHLIEAGAVGTTTAGSRASIRYIRHIGKSQSK
jgi:hypothetical protein